jgi:hypothetical protein
MTLDAFRARLGVDQGRVVSDGHAVFVLGTLTPGRTHELASGDYAEIVQVVDLTTADLLRVGATSSMPTITDPLRWRLVIRVDGVALAQRLLPSGRTVEVHDLAANVASLAGPHEVAVRLELGAA